MVLSIPYKHIERNNVILNEVKDLVHKKKILKKILRLTAQNDKTVRRLRAC